jgi:hypothetical protein
VPGFCERTFERVTPTSWRKRLPAQEEPTVGLPEPGDLEIRFRLKGPFDVGDLNCAIELRTKLYASRLETKQERAELIKAGLSKALPGIKYLGVWLVLVDGWWTQT